MRRHLLLLVVALSIAPTSAWAQPAMSRGEQFLPIDHECMARAQQALRAEGFSSPGRGGSFVLAFKGNHGAYITCNLVPNNQVVVNVFVASEETSSVPREPDGCCCAVSDSMSRQAYQDSRAP